MVSLKFQNVQAVPKSLYSYVYYQTVFDFVEQEYNEWVYFHFGQPFTWTKANEFGKVQDYSSADGP